MKRIIPAGAGNSDQPDGTPAANTDHPRRRGELRLRPPNIPGRVGSSPQARGTPPCRACTPKPQRIIPAGAGNSLRARSSISAETDHPRRRGELSLILQLSPRARGSSPQARGTLYHADTGGIPQRIIPAGAGNSKNSSKHPPQLTDHPRRRGELNITQRFADGGIGSSPQARGTLLTMQRIF